MLTQVTRATYNKNCHSVDYSYSNINLMVKLIREIDMFNI